MRVRRWRPAVTRLGRLRQWVLHRVLWYQSETCDRCGGRVGIAWWCDDRSLWRQAYQHATGRVTVETCEAHDSGLLCPRCFESAAAAVGVVMLWRAADIRKQRL